jgi:hypothetical protein
MPLLGWFGLRKAIFDVLAILPRWLLETEHTSVQSQNSNQPSHKAGDFLISYTSFILFSIT